MNAAARAREARRGNTIKYNVPKEGAVLFFDLMAVPADAPHPRNAQLFINYMMRPEVSARNSSLVHYATANVAAYPLVDPTVYNDRGIYPTPETRQDWSRICLESAALPDCWRMWSRFKSGH